MAEKAKKKSNSPKSTSNNQSLSNQLTSTEGKTMAVIIVFILLVFLIAYLSKGLFVAASVNGEAISRIAVIKVLEKQSGAMALENMITKELILQEAERRNIEVTEKDLENEIKSISDNLKTQGTTLEAAMEAQGMTREDLNDELRVQIALRRMVENEVKVTDKEIAEFIIANDSQFAEGTTDEQKKKLARAQLQQEKSAQKTQELLANLQKKAKILRYAGY